jgi:hypothetical protein
VCAGSLVVSVLPLVLEQGGAGYDAVRLVPAVGQPGGHSDVVHPREQLPGCGQRQACGVEQESG